MLPIPTVMQDDPEQPSETRRPVRRLPCVLGFVLVWLTALLALGAAPIEACGPEHVAWQATAAAAAPATPQVAPTASLDRDDSWIRFAAEDDGERSEFEEECLAPEPFVLGGPAVQRATVARVVVTATGAAWLVRRSRAPPARVGARVSARAG